MRPRTTTIVVVAVLVVVAAFLLGGLGDEIAPPAVPSSPVEHTAGPPASSARSS